MLYCADKRFGKDTVLGFLSGRLRIVQSDQNSVREGVIEKASVKEGKLSIDLGKNALFVTGLDPQEEDGFVFNVDLEDYTALTDHDDLDGQKGYYCSSVALDPCSFYIFINHD